MGMVVQHNMNALNAYNKLNTNVAGLKKSSEKLSSGYRINRAGDDAAGLAISEKMRSQIRGLNQAKRNAQDGISMIQTFEGAAQESHSILQRMKELAAEAANGTYQNEVDRDAIQLEFDQLNDELDQIADTDFNGTVMLNGGTMADGTEQVNGKFTYVANDPRTEAMQWSNSDVNTIDSKAYNNNTTSSTNLWNNLGLDKDVESVNLTFKYSKDTDTWELDSSDSAAALANKANIIVKKGSTTGTGAAKNNGGFSLVSTATQGAGSVQIGGTAPAAGIEYANVVLDSTKLVDGDTVTINFTRPKVSNTAPENAGIVENSIEMNLTSGADKTSLTAPTIAVNKAGVDGQYESTNISTANKPMTAEAAKAFNGLDGAKFEVTYKNTAATTGEVENVKITLADGKEATFAKDASGVGLIAEDGTAYKVTVDAGVVTIKDSKDVELLAVTLDNTLTGTGMGGTATSKYSFSIAMDTAIFDEAKQPTASIVDAPQGNQVSKSDSNNAATAPLTYTDHLVLQTGARTKDSVDFTFSYKTEGMGDLKANMNISSRADGLGTKNLSLNTQESANAAIDKIDNAINKVSMVRATFGATQNRLEHKVENLTTTAENLTEAESGIRDTDMASEMLNYTKFNVLQQAAQSMLAQANQQPQSILQLLG